MIAEVLVNLPIGRPFDYVVPAPWRDLVRRGVRVMVPFGPRRLVGYVQGVRERSAVKRLKVILRVLDERPVLTEDGFRLARWLTDSYGVSLGEACAAIVPTAARLSATSPDEPPSAIPADPPPALTAQQRTAFSAIDSAIGAMRYERFLVHGVTGSGKTELYLRAIAAALAQGRSAICLVPEIAITPQTIDRFRQRFGADVAIWHSRLTAKQRSHEWRRVIEGRCRIIVGTRSAIFAPLAHIGVIVLDEEHDPSYKQDQTPRYHARDVAMARAEQHQAVVILGSATPSLESYYHAQRGRYRLLELTERVQGRPMPHVELIDMRREFARGRRALPISVRLEVALRQALDRREQAILLLNRRGFARVIVCPACGLVLRCPDCAVPIIYHARPPQLLCHYCGRRQTPPDLCPGCQQGYLRYRGSGTERIESELSRLFPDSEVGRMDADTTTARDSHRRLYEALRDHHLHVLVGTQMVAKGFDIPQVTLVGVVSADTSLNLPDFRAGERTFALLTQVAGRAGRGERPGEVLVQTYCPEHYAIQAASRQQYREFYEAEIRMRERLRLPPLVHLIELTIQGRKAETVQRVAEAMARALRERLRRRRVVLLGPAPHRVETIRRTTRWRIILKTTTVASTVAVIRQLIGDARRFQGLPVIIDVDPL